MASGEGFVVVTGTLAQRNDVPVFTLDLTSPFGVGLPVPPRYDVEDIRQRYVVCDVQWEVAEKRSKDVPADETNK